MQEKSFANIKRCWTKPLLVSTILVLFLFANQAQAIHPAYATTIQQQHSTRAIPLIQENNLNFAFFYNGVPFFGYETGSVSWGVTLYLQLSHIYMGVDVVNGYNYPFSIGAYTDIYAHINNDNPVNIYIQDANNCYYPASDVVYCGDNFGTYNIAPSYGDRTFQHYELVTGASQYASINYSHQWY